MRFVLAYLLHDAQEVDRRVKVAPRKFGDGLLGVRRLRGREAKLLDVGTFTGVLAFLKGKSWKLVAGAIDGITTELDSGRCGVVFAFLIGFETNGLRFNGGIFAMRIAEGKVAETGQRRVEDAKVEHTSFHYGRFCCPQPCRCPDGRIALAQEEGSSSRAKVE